MTRKFPLIYLAYLVILLYFSIHAFSWILPFFWLPALWGLFLVNRQSWLLVGGVLAVFGIFFAYQSYRQQEVQANHPDQVSEIILLVDTIQINGDQLSVQAKSDGYFYQVFYRLKNQEEQTYFAQLKRTVLVRGEMTLTEPDGQRNFSGFDYRAHLSSQGIYRLLHLERIDEIAPVGVRSPRLLMREWRRSALVFINQHFPSPMKHYMTGLLFGYLGKDFDEMADLYSSLGIIHLFALSGMQVGFFIRAFRRIFLRLGLTIETVDRLQIPFSLLYAGLTGFSVSVWRALLQAGWRRFGFRGMDNLGLTILLMFLLKPHFLQTKGGVLSFAYAFVIGLFQFEELSGWRKQVVKTISLPLAVCPFLLWYFGSFQPVSILLTLILAFLFDQLILPLLAVTFALSPFVIITWGNFLFQFLENILRGLGDLLGSALVFGQPSSFLLLVMIIVIGVSYDFRQKKQILSYTFPLLCLCLTLTKFPLENEVTVVDVGQGDSIFLREIGGRSLLIDTGGRVEFGSPEDWQVRSQKSNASRTLIPYLKSRGVGKIDQLLITHTDTDHMGDIEEVAKNFKIGEILVSEGSLTNSRFVERLRDMGVKVRVLTAGDDLPIMGSQLYVLYPWEQGDGSNNDSLVLYGQLLGESFLFTGDLEEGELDLINRYPNLPVDILKAGHHGSKGSSYPEFLDHINPKLALISAGKNNRYQHPHTETMERFEERQIAVYRTDHQGAIRFRGIREWQLETVR